MAWRVGGEKTGGKLDENPLKISCRPSGENVNGVS
jgi:hypothetical protein